MHSPKVSLFNLLRTAMHFGVALISVLGVHGLISTDHFLKALNWSVAVFMVYIINGREACQEGWDPDEYSHIFSSRPSKRLTHFFKLERRSDICRLSTFLCISPRIAIGLYIALHGQKFGDGEIVFTSPVKWVVDSTAVVWICFLGSLIYEVVYKEEEYEEGQESD